MKQFENIEGEIWVLVNDYKGYYEVSNFGDVRSVDRTIITKGGVKLRYKGRILRPSTDSAGYLRVGLCKNCKQESGLIHSLVWDAFGFGKRNLHTLEVDHVNSIKTDNRIGNLQLLSCRDNVIKYHKTQKTTSKYPGVSWDTTRNKWKAQIYIGKQTYIGRFNCETAAMIAYQQELFKIKKQNASV